MRCYFAYGSNLWLEQMRQRCPDHQVLGPGVLTGHRWIITSRGYANVVLSAADLVLGVVYRISATDEERLDRFEGVAQGAYRKAVLPVETAQGTLSCLIYLDWQEQEGEPCEEYVQRMRYGIRDARLPSLYLERYLDKVTLEPALYAVAS